MQPAVGEGGLERAKYPNVEVYVDRNGVKIGYEVCGDGEPAVVFAPPDAIVDSRAWMAQVPYLARRLKLEGGHDRPARQRRTRPAGHRRGLR